MLHRLPEKQELSALEDAARTAYDAASNASVVAVPGSEIAIRLMPRVAPAEVPAFILSPTYSSHRAAWPSAALAATEDVIPDGAIVILANPNNPDGRLMSRERMVALARRLRWLVVDEAFADVAPNASLLPELPGNALVLRSFGKFYGLPGLRLGFVFGPAETCARIRATLGDWAVSGPAIAAGKAALRDTAWRDAMRIQLAAEASALASLLTVHGLRVIGRTSLFVLAAADDAPRLHAGLAKRGVWTRAFAEEPTWLRFALPGKDFRRLEQALGGL
jgi:cobalamin biosynthetic protein CobC